MNVTRELKMILIARSGLMKTSKMMTREMYLTFFMMRKVCKLIFYCDMMANRCIQNPWKNHLSFSTRVCLFLVINPQYRGFVIWETLCNFFYDVFSKNITCPYSRCNICCCNAICFSGKQKEDTALFCLQILPPS